MAQPGTEHWCKTMENCLYPQQQGPSWAWSRPARVPCHCCAFLGFAWTSALPLPATGQGTFWGDYMSPRILPALTSRGSQASTEMHSNPTNVSFQCSVLRVHHSAIAMF